MADNAQNLIDKYLRSLNEAMAIHAEKALEKANATSTKIELVEIVDITNRDSGWYVVWNGSTRYKATSQEKYGIGTKVYVTIPNGDFNQQKYISGLYYDGTNETEYFYDYELPFTTFSKVSDNLLNNIETYSLLANCNKEGEKPTFGSQAIRLGKISEHNDGSNYLGVAANFKAILGENVEGTYGLRLNITATNKEGLEDNRIYYLRSSENMIGNIYNFSSFIQQQARFDIKDLNVSNITVDFFQGGDFKDGNGDAASWQYEGQLLPDNIFVKDIEVYYGVDKQTEENILRLYTDDGLTYNSRDGDGQESSPNYNQKTIKLKWQYQDLTVENSDIQFITSKQDAINILGIDSNINIHWYKKMDSVAYALFKGDMEERIKTYEEQLKVLERWEKNWILTEDLTEEEIEVIKIEDTDFIIGNFFCLNPEYYNPDTNKFTNSGNILLGNLIRNIRNILGSDEETTVQNNSTGEAGLRQIYKQTFLNNALEDGWCLIGDDIFELDIIPDLERKTTEYMVVVEYGPWKTAIDDWEREYEIIGEYDTESLDYHKVIAVEPLVLTNLGDIPDEAALKNAAAQFIFDDGGLNGEYRIYDAHGGNLIDGNYANRIFSIEMICNSEITGNYLNPSSDIVIWKVPKVNTRTMFYTLDEESDNILDSKDQLFKRFSNILKYDPSYTFIKKNINKYSINYQVSPNYRANAVNNKITCYVIQSSGVIEKEQEILFSQFDYAGSDYMFTLNLGQLVVPVSKGIRNDENAPRERSIYKEYPTGFEWDVDFKVIGPQDNTITCYANESEGYKNYYREIEIHLYNSRNREVSLTNKEKDDIIKLWVGKEIEGCFWGNYSDFDFIPVMTKEVKDDDSVEFYATRVAVRAERVPSTGLILKAEYIKPDDDTNEDIKYTQLLSLPVQMYHYQLNGPTAIVYDTSGSKYYTLPQDTHVTLSYYYQENLDLENNRWEQESSQLKEIISQATYNNWKNSTEQTREALADAEENYNKKLLAHQVKQLEIKSSCYKKLLNEENKTDSDSTEAISYYSTINSSAYPPLRLNSVLLNEILPMADGEDRVFSYAAKEIIPPVGYVEGNTTCYLLNFYDRSDDYASDGDKNESLIGSLPIAVVQNRFNVPGEDQWYNAIVLESIDEDTEVVENNGMRLLAAPLSRSASSVEKNEIIKINSGTLARNNENKISGTLIGTVKINNGNPINGLFGYNNNDLIFKIGTDGEAFLGKKGAGRISFSGNSGQIMSQSRVDSINSEHPNGTVGSLIDLKSGAIDLVDDNYSGAMVHIGTTSVLKENFRSPWGARIYHDGNKTNTDLANWHVEEELISKGTVNTDQVYFSINAKKDNNNDIVGTRLISIGDIPTTLRYRNALTGDTVFDRYTLKDNIRIINNINYEETEWGNSFIQTKDFNRFKTSQHEDNRAGLRIDLSNGNFESYADFTIMSSDIITLDGDVRILGDVSIGGVPVTAENGELVLAANLIEDLADISLGEFKNKPFSWVENGIQYVRGPYAEREELKAYQPLIDDNNLLEMKYIKGLTNGIADVAITGSYLNLLNTPNIPDAYSKDVIDRLGLLLKRKGLIDDQEWANVVGNEGNE